MSRLMTRTEVYILVIAADLKAMCPLVFINKGVITSVPVPPLFGLQGPYPTFQDEKVKNLLSPAVNRDDLRILNYNKTVFGWGFASDTAGRAHDAHPDPRVG